MRITNTESACPNLNQYQQLASGQLAEIEAEWLLSHLENCAACAQTMKTLPEPDTLVGMLRQADTVAQETNKKEIAGLVEDKHRGRGVTALAPRRVLLRTGFALGQRARPLQRAGQHLRSKSICPSPRCQRFANWRRGQQ